jgi:ribosome maturation factor RimP
MISEDLIKTLTEQHIAGSDKFVVSVKVKQGNKIAVFIDADNAVSIDDCIKLSRFIESQLDRETEDFELDVSSAGLDLPLKMERQYKKNIGKEIKVVLKNGTVKIGKLNSVSKDGFELTETITEKIIKKRETRIISTQCAFDEVKETRIVINF